jgi:alpha-beta hydrolase superfamily lysophospholipase
VNLIFLHGYGEHSGLYHRFGNTLGTAGIDLWALDEIGHGLSEGERAVIGSIDDLVENGRRLTTLAQVASPENQLFLAGHSLGAAAATVFATRSPELFRGLIVSGAPLSPLAWVSDIDPDGPDVEISLELDDLSSDPFYLDELTNDPLAFTAGGGARSLARILPPTWSELDQSLATVDMPILFLHGSEDPVVPVAQARHNSERAARGELRVFDGARHDVLNDSAHHSVAQEIISFMTKNLRPAQGSSLSAQL